MLECYNGPISYLGLACIMTKLRVVYIVNHVAFFVSHRLPLALKALDNGFNISFTGKAGSEEMEALAVNQLSAYDISHKRCIFSSSGMQPIIEVLGLLQLVWFVFRLKPDLLYCASPKAVLYGGIAARLCGVPGLVPLFRDLVMPSQKGQSLAF